MKKKVIFLVFLLIAVFALSGCSSYVSSQALQVDWLVFLLSLISAGIFLGFFYWIKKTSVRYKEIKPEYKGESEVTFLFVVCGVFFLRLLFAVLIKGFRDDIADLSEWAFYLADNGPFDFYKAYPDSNLLPGYVYLLTVLGSIARLFNFSNANNTMALLIKLPNIICDMISMYLIFKITKKYSNDTFALILSLLFGLDLSALFLSSVWGGFDSIAVLLILLAVYFMIDKKICKMIICIASATLIKWYSVILLPVFIIYSINVYRKNKKTDYAYLRKDIVLTALLSVAVILLIYFSLSFNSLYNGNIFKMIYDKFICANINFQQYSFDAFNLFTMLGVNRINMNLTANIINLFILILIITAGIILYFKKSDRKDFVLVCALMLSAYVSFSMQISAPMTAIAVGLLYMSFSIYKDFRLYIVTAVMSFLSFFNMAIVLNALKQLNAYILSGTYSGITPNGFWMIFGSVLQILSFIYLCYIAFDIIINKNKKIITKENLNI